MAFACRLMSTTTTTAVLLHHSRRPCWIRCSSSSIRSSSISSSSSPVASTTTTATTARARVLMGYRRLFRARKLLFGGDAVAYKESRMAIKSEFVKNRHVPTSGESFEKLLIMIDEAADMMQHGILRGEYNSQTGNYGTFVVVVVVLLLLPLLSLLVWGAIVVQVGMGREGG